jgi:hypothetical protein
MSVTKIFKNPEKREYAVVSHRSDMPLNFGFIGDNGKEHWETVGEIYDLNPPLNQGNMQYLNKKDLLKALKASGAREGEIKRIESKL